MLSNIGIKLFLLARTGDLIQRHKISENPSVGIKLRIVRSLAFITFIPTYCATVRLQRDELKNERASEI